MRKYLGAGAGLLVAAVAVTAAVLALGKVGPPVEAVSALVAALGDGDGEVRAAAAGALGGVKPPAPETLPALRKVAAGDPDLAARLAAIAILGRCADADAVPVL